VASRAGQQGQQADDAAGKSSYFPVAGDYTYDHFKEHAADERHLLRLQRKRAEVGPDAVARTPLPWEESKKINEAVVSVALV